MADILIRGMEMPEGCHKCKLCYYVKGETNGGEPCTVLMCSVISQGTNEAEYNGSRPSWCPLVPLPERHGRLGDLDALLESMRESYQKAQEWRDNSSGEIYDRADATVMAFLEFGNRTKNAPTIVPAEGGGEE